jgi:hypothetical protein
MSITISPSMTVQQIAELVETNKVRDMDVYVRIESVGGKPFAYLVSEARTWIPPLLRQAD